MYVFQCIEVQQVTSLLTIRKTICVSITMDEKPVPTHPVDSCTTILAVSTPLN